MKQTKSFRWSIRAIGLSIAALLWFWPQIASSSKLKGHSETNVSAASLEFANHRGSVTSRPIESIRVGDRVLAHNPEVSDNERASWKEPDWSQWLKLSLVMPKEDGSELKMELLRNEDWVRSQVSWVMEEFDKSVIDGANDCRGKPDPLVQQIELAEPGLDVPLSPLRPIFRELVTAEAALAISCVKLSALLVEMDLPELAITGLAVVVDIQPAPRLATGAGRVVTATFRLGSHSGIISDITGGSGHYRPTLANVERAKEWLIYNGHLSRDIPVSVHAF